MNLKRILCAAAWLMSATICSAETGWSDVTNTFIKNATFDNNLSDGWTWDSSTGTVGTAASCLRFYNGSCTFSYKVNNLPKGSYRLSVQGFYRSNYDSYESYQEGTENITAFLYANDATTPLVSVYSEGLTEEGPGNWQQHDGRFFPNNSTSANAAFETGLYKGNCLEFEAQGDVTIGVKCTANEGGNYCVLDNFKLEYKSPISPDGKAWIDITSQVLKNPTFDDNSQEGWIWESNTQSSTARVNCMEFWTGTFNIHQEMNYGHSGKYRLSVQALYRCGDNDQSYRNYQKGTENIPAVMYAGDAEQKLVSVYSEPSNDWTDGAWGAGGGWWGGAPYFPNSMESARVWFDRGKYWNTMEFEADGKFLVGLKTESSQNNNWCIFDNFKLEYYGDYVRVTDISIKLENTKLVVGETAQASVIVAPANATVNSVEWSSGDEQVVSVSKEGMITAISAGTATIYATAVDGSGVKGSVTITVEHNPAKPGSILINEIMASNVDEMLSPALNFDGWIELYNPTNKPVELNGLKLNLDADEAWTMPSDMGAVPANGFAVVWFDSNDLNQHNAPFKLDTDGATITLTDAAGTVIDRQTYPKALERISYARATDGTGDWGFASKTTMGVSNNGIKLLTQQLAAPVVNQPSQLFTGDLIVNVTIPGYCTLRYTTDGTLPTLENGETSTNGQFTVTGTSSYRFRLFADDMLPSRVTTRSYIEKDRDYYLPVVSVVTDPDFLYSREIGVMEKGPNGRPGNGQSSKCNWNMNWERPVNFSYLDENGEMVLNQDVNLEMCGGWSRAWTPHAFKLKGTKEMGGEKDLLYPFFLQKPFIRNRTLQIRNGGNDTSCRIKDPALQYLAQSSGMNVDCQSYQPVHEFINGSYIGVLNVREPNNKHYVYANYGWDDDEIDQFEMSPDSGYVQKCGTPDAFNELVDDLSPDAANSDTYEEICRRLDIDAYANYMAIQMYLGNWDWPQNNVKGFRHCNDGKFRFVLFDLDGSFSTDSPFDTFAGKEWYRFDQLYPTSLGRIIDQIRFVTLFENMLKNADFRRLFIDAYCIVGGSVYEKTRATEIVTELSDFVEPAMKLNGTSTKSTVNTIRSRLSSRLNSAINSLKNYSAFELKSSTPRNIELSSDIEGAIIMINDVPVPTGRFNGKIFPPAKIKVIAPAGYVFHSWKKNGTSIYSTKEEFELPTSDMNLVACFMTMSDSKKKEQNITPVRINEVSGSNDSFIDEYGKKGDWVELYNTTDEEIDTEGMYLSDDLNNPTKYMITKGDTKAQTKIAPHGHLVVWCDNKRATTDHGLHASFKISGNGGVVTLTAANRSWKDMLVYDAHDANTTVGRFPDGTTDVYAMSTATIGKSNIYTSYMAAVSQDIEHTGIAYIAAANGLRMCYGSNQLLVKSDDDETITVSIYRADGQLVEQSSLGIQGGKARLSVAHLNQGFYVAKVTSSGGNSVSCKFMK